MAFKLLLFDIDGTLLLGGRLGRKAIQSAGKIVFGESFTTQGLDAAGKIDLQIYEELIDLNPSLAIREQHNKFKESYFEQLELSLAELEQQLVLPGVFALLAGLREVNTSLGLLTGNYTKAAPIKLNAAGIDPTWFSITAFGDEALSRGELPPIAMKKYEAHFGEIAPHEVVIIGDTPRDVACAHANGCYALAVATGKWSFNELQDTGANKVLQDLSDTHDVLELLTR